MTYREALDQLEAFMNERGVLDEKWYEKIADVLDWALERQYDNDN